MEYLSPHIILRKGLIQGIEYPHLADHLSDFLSKMLFRTSGLSLTTQEKKKRVSLFCGNHELCKTTEQVLIQRSFTHFQGYLHRSLHTSTLQSVD